MDHEGGGGVGFKEVVDVRDDRYDRGRGCKEGSSGEAFDEGRDQSGGETGGG